ncbi:MAG: hypothetical protein LBB81_01965 [Treponema sp.]|nr:hypothetical protein [Treponema sp.]
MNRLAGFFLLLICLSSAVICDAQDLDTLWRMFLNDEDSPAGAEIIITIGKTGRGNRQAVDYINNYLNRQTEIYSAGTVVNYSVISACISAVLDMGDASSYDVLFTMFCANYPEVISDEAAGAMDLIPGNLKQFLINIIDKYPSPDKLAALRLCVNSQALSSFDRGQLAELALEISLDSPPDADLDVMRYLAVVTLTQLRWARASSLAINNYYRVQADYYRGLVSRERLLEAIACLGAVGNSNAALVIILHLGLINARTGKNSFYDSDITTAYIQALGIIGDKAALDHLLHITYLSYGENIQAAAREAIDRLKW